MNETGLLLTFEFPPYPGGIGTYSYQIARHFDSMGIDLWVATKTSAEHFQDVATFDQGQPFPIYRFRPHNARILKAVDRTLETVNLCRRHNIRWIYCCSYNASYIAAVCKQLLGIPYFLAGYGTEFTTITPSKRYLLNQATQVFVISRYTAGLIQDYCRRPVSVIPLGADEEHYDPARLSPDLVADVRQRYARERGPVLLSVGRLNERKGHLTTVQALTQIKTHYPAVQLLIVGRSVSGSEDYEQTLRSYVRDSGLADNVAFIPVVTPDELAALYSLADVFIMSSVEYKGDVEGFGIALIEANLMETPVVASRSGGIPDAVEEGASGLLYAPGNAAELAAQTLTLLDNAALRNALGKWGRTRALRSFTWSRVALQTWDVMAERLPGLPPHHPPGA